MGRITDYDIRRKDVLKATIEIYLETAQPVSSENLLEYGFDLSSATIRNILRELEQMGYLTHPHTSAGRIPTDLGYRLYIKEAMYKKNLEPKEKDTLRQFFNSYIDNNGDVWINASKLISDFTHYLGLVSEEGERTVRHCGFTYLFDQPEFRDMSTIRSISQALEEDRFMDLMNKHMDAPLEVMVGEESDCPGMDKCTVIICECKKEGRKVGRLGVVGPKRMAYNWVIPMVDYLSELIVEESKY